jgi:hypothetical protein
MLNAEKVVKCIRKIFGDEYRNVRVIQAGSSFRVEIVDMIHDGVWIRSENTMEEKIDELFYDYCLENADWMGVS